MRHGYSGIPRWVLGLAAAGALFILLPLAAMVARVNWAQFIPLLTSDASLTALGLSLRTAAASTALCVLLGVPLALVLARAASDVRSAGAGRARSGRRRRRSRSSWSERARTSSASERAGLAAPAVVAVSVGT